MKSLILSNVSGSRGAPIGRSNTLPDDPDESEFDLLIARLRWVDQCYDSGGAYWGNDDKTGIYCAYNAIEDGELIEIFVRAKDLKDAKNLVREILPNAKIEIGREAVSIAGESIDEFTLAYLEAALWASNDDEGLPLDARYEIENFSQDAIKKAKADCERFQSENADDIRDASYNFAGYSDGEMAGHDFFLTRCGHGAGFWDRELGDIGDRLTQAAKEFGEATPYVGDDGLIHF